MIAEVVQHNNVSIVIYIHFIEDDLVSFTEQKVDLGVYVVTPFISKAIF